jgi:response regulator of citrate/malate metabolism
MATKNKRELLDAIEDYVMKSYDVVRLKSDLSRNYKKSAEMQLSKKLNATAIDDIVAIFDDLRDYWDTLEIGE